MTATPRHKTPSKPPAKPRNKAQHGAADAPRFSTLPTFRLDTLASISAKHGELLYERLFGLRTVECRVLGVVQSYQPVSLRAACVEIGLDKSQGSRLVAKLVGAGWLERRDDPADQRSFYLLLTPAGRELHGRILAAAQERNRRWMTGLPAALQAAFLHAIEQQIQHARGLLDDELARSQRAAPPMPLHEQAAPVARPPGPLLVDRAALLAIHRQLAGLLAADATTKP